MASRSAARIYTMGRIDLGIPIFYKYKLEISVIHSGSNQNGRLRIFEARLELDF